MFFYLPVTVCENKWGKVERRIGIRDTNERVPVFQRQRSGRDEIAVLRKTCIRSEAGARGQ